MMTVYAFHCDVKKQFCQTLNIQPPDIYNRMRYKHMLPKSFFFVCLSANINTDTECLVCKKVFFQNLKNKITISINTEGYFQCLLILIKYAALCYTNVKQRHDPYYFLTWFEPEDIRCALQWQENLNGDRTSFLMMEYLKLDHLVFSTIVCHLITVSFETIPQCKNLLAYCQLLTSPQKRHKPVKLITYQNGITEKEAIMLRQIFEHIKITRGVLDDQTGNSSVIRALRNNENPYKNSAIVTQETNRQGFKNIFIPIHDETSNFIGLLLLDGKKSKTLENDYLSALVVYSLAPNTEHILVDSIVFDHNLILNTPEMQFYDYYTGKCNVNDDCQLLTRGLNNLLFWCLNNNNQTKPKDNNGCCISQQKENEITSTFIPTNDDYEKYRQEFGTFIKDVLLYHYQAGDIEHKFQLLKNKTGTKTSSLHQHV